MKTILLISLILVGCSTTPLTPGSYEHRKRQCITERYKDCRNMIHEYEQHKGVIVVYPGGTHSMCYHRAQFICK